jgi:Protein of unknown function (DUF455)
MTRLLARHDTATILRRFWHLERAVVIACAAWVPDVRRIESKALLARTAWQNAMTAHSLRERVFELRYPDRSLDAGVDAPLLKLFAAVLHAPDGAAVMHALATVFLPAQRDAYEAYLGASDDIADGPTRRFLALAVAEKKSQIEELRPASATEGLDGAARLWTEELSATLSRLGGLGLEAPQAISVPEVFGSGRRFRLTDQPARDERYFACSFYWPDILDPAYPYGEGVRLRVRSAVSHLNEVWAVETAGAILHGYSGDLGWDFVFDAARWLYDESRHMLMGARRLADWGLERRDVPLGSYIYEAGAGEDLIYRMAMLAYFETKNISKKRDRVASFAALGDEASERDMDFDWADEAIHAGYGRKWLRSALELRGEDPGDWHRLVTRCEQLVRKRVERATASEREAIVTCAENLVATAARLITSSGHAREESQAR